MQTDAGENASKAHFNQGKPGFNPGKPGFNPGSSKAENHVFPGKEGADDLCCNLLRMYIFFTE